MKKQSCVIWIQTDKTNNIYKDIAEYVETRFNTSNHELDRLLPKEKNKKQLD